MSRGVTGLVQCFNLCLHCARCPGEREGCSSWTRATLATRAMAAKPVNIRGVMLSCPGDREVTFRFKNRVERKFTGRSLLFTLSIPQFFFHLTTAYDILRRAGVEIVKKDFPGPA